MTIHKDSWHFSAFMFGCRLVDIFRQPKYCDTNWYSYRFRRGTNLCHYMRVIMVYTPLILATYVAFAAAGVYALVVSPIQLFGLTGYGITIGIIVGIIVGFFAICFVAMLIADGWSRLKNAISAKLDKGEEERSEVVDKGPSFIELSVDWVKAKKQKICPIISFETAQSN